MERSSQWKTGPLVLVGERLAIKGEEDAGGFHCGEPLEIEVAPGIWIRGSAELNHDLTIRQLTNGGQITGEHEEWQGWYLQIGNYSTGVRRVFLIPGVMARTYNGLDWPEPSTPYEGQAYKSRYGGWKVYRGGQWVKDEES